MTFVDERKAEVLATLEELAQHYGRDYINTLPFDNSHEDVTLRRDKQDKNRYWVSLRGHKIGWAYKTFDGYWEVFLSTGGVQGHKVRADGSKRRYALYDLLCEAMTIGHRGYF